jgi:hypothetical protein
MNKLLITIIFTSLSLLFGNDRNSLIYAPILKERIQTRYIAELDLNGDSIKDLIISDSISLSGSGGHAFEIYLGNQDGTFHNTEKPFLASMLSLEICSETKRRRLWCYTHSSARSGSIYYFEFREKKKVEQSNSLLIHSSVEGKEVGDKVLNSIFNQTIKLQEINLKGQP